RPVEWEMRRADYIQKLAAIARTGLVSPERARLANALLEGFKGRVRLARGRPCQEPLRRCSGISSASHRGQLHGRLHSDKMARGQRSALRLPILLRDGCRFVRWNMAFLFAAPCGAWIRGSCKSGGRSTESDRPPVLCHWPHISDRDIHF